MGCRDTLLPKTLLKNHNVISLNLERKLRQAYNDNLCSFRGFALHLHGNDKLEEETAFFSSFSLRVRKEMPQKIKAFKQMRFELSKKLCSSILFCMNLISLIENSLVNWLVELPRNMGKVSSFYKTTITFAASTASTQYSKPSHAVLLTYFFLQLAIYKDFWLLAENA